MPPADLATFEKRADLLPQPPMAFTPAGGYGIAVHHGDVTFRNVRLLPLNP